MSLTPSRSTSRILALDGLRGLAALVVVIAHAIAAIWVPVRVPLLGIQLFFVLSGYCLAESAVRRIFRIHRPTSSDRPSPGV